MIRDVNNKECQNAVEKCENNIMAKKDQYSSEELEKLQDEIETFNKFKYLEMELDGFKAIEEKVKRTIAYVR